MAWKAEQRVERHGDAITAYWSVLDEAGNLLAYKLTRPEAMAIATARENAERVERARGLLGRWLIVQGDKRTEVFEDTRAFLAETDTETGDG